MEKLNESVDLSKYRPNLDVTTHCWPLFQQLVIDLSRVFSLDEALAVSMVLVGYFFEFLAYLRT